MTNVRALALSVAHSRPCASVVVLSFNEDGPGLTKMDLAAHSETDATVAASGPPGHARLARRAACTYRGNRRF